MKDETPMNGNGSAHDGNFRGGPLDARAFDERLHAWLDGELSPDAERAMESWCETHPEAKDLAERERAFDARIRGALLAGNGGRETVATALRRTRPATPLFARRGIAAAASVLVAVTGFLWFNCVPPFECSYVGAMESAATLPAVRSEPLAADRMSAALGVVGTVSATFDLVNVKHCCGEESARWSLALADGTRVAVVEGRCSHTDPSFRRLRESDGWSCWVAEKKDDTVVCFRDPGSGRLISLVAPVPAARLEQAARSLSVALGR